MYSRAASSFRSSSARIMFRQKPQQQRRNMGGGRHFMHVSDVHAKLGEAFGFICWMWIFHRARNDLPVVLGWRHPWEHADDLWSSNIEEKVENIVQLQNDWDKFAAKASDPSEGDDDEEDEELNQDDELEEVSSSAQLEDDWDKFAEKATHPGDDDEEED